MLEPCWCVGVGTQSVIFWLNLSFRGALFQDKYSFSIHFLPLPCLQSSKSISLKPLTSVDYVMFLFLFLPQWGRKAGGGWSREEFPYSSWNQVSEFSPAKSLPLRVSHYYGKGSEQYFLTPTPLLLQDPWGDPACTLAMGTWLSSSSESLWKCAPCNKTTSLRAFWLTLVPLHH